MASGIQVDYLWFAKLAWGPYPESPSNLRGPGLESRSNLRGPGLESLSNLRGPGLESPSNLRVLVLQASQI